MSSILKALRKLEDEKASMGEGGVDLAHDILKGHFAERRALPWIIIAASGCLLLLIAATGGWWLYGALATPPAKVAQTVPPTPVVAPPVSLPEKLPETEQIDEQAGSSVSEVVKMPAEELRVSSRQTGDLKPVASAVVAEEAALLDIPDLRVEEIIFHQQPESRLAVINDLPVMEGTDIDGAHVEEIMPDRVRFSFQGVRFNKFLTKPGT